MEIKKILFKTDASWAGLIARVTLGVVMLPHGLQKTLGLFGGYGFSGTMGFFTEQMGIPAIFALAAILAESLGALGLIVGAFSRLAALGISITMAVAAFTAHSGNGFFMNWFGNQKGEGYEYHLLAIGLGLIVVIVGGGKASIDHVMWKKCEAKH